MGVIALDKTIHLKNPLLSFIKISFESSNQTNLLLQEILLFMLQCKKKLMNVSIINFFFLRCHCRLLNKLYVAVSFGGNPSTNYSDL